MDLGPTQDPTAPTDATDATTDATTDAATTDPDSGATNLFSSTLLLALLVFVANLASAIRI